MTKVKQINQPNRKMRITRKQITKAIKEEMGLNIQVHLVPNVNAHFFSDDDDVANKLALVDNGVAVARLSHLTLKQWVREFKIIWHCAGIQEDWCRH